WAILEILGVRAPRDLVRQAADSPFAWVRKKALELVGDQAPFLAILPFVEDPHYENRDPDSPLLRLLGVVATPEQLIDVLEHSIYPEVRESAAGDLAHHDQPAARAALLRALSAEDAGVRAEA